MELVDQAQKAYLLAEPSSDWREKLPEAAANIPDSFWADSLLIAPDETAATLSSTLSLLLEGAGREGRVKTPSPGELSARATRHLTDLARLHEAINFVLPPHLAAMADIIAAPKARAVRVVSVHYSAKEIRLNPWQRALLEKLGSDAGERSPDLDALYAKAVLHEPAGKKGRALAHLQKGLFESEIKVATRDDSIQWLAVRDFLEEIEVAVGMAQKALLDDPSLVTSEIGFLVPTDQTYTDALRSVCNYAGLPLSGLPDEKEARDLGKEAVLYFLLTCRRPAPAMALATLLSSPLMPWTAEVGKQYAQEIMDGGFDLKATDELSINSKRMLKLIRQTADSSPVLRDALSQFASLLQATEGLEGHLARALATLEKGKECLSKSGEIPWGDLMRIASPEAISASVSSPITREGIAIFTEQEQPWRKVRQLFVLGFSNGRYPGDPSRSAIFSDVDLACLQQIGGYDLETSEGIAQRRRELFKQQLYASSQRINFLIPRRDCFGKELRPSQSLTYMAKLFGVNDPEDLILELESSTARAKARGIAVATTASPKTPRLLTKQDLSLQRDLLALHCYADGSPKPQSPSSLDTLMVSPFAWLLSRAGLQPLDWAPEDLDVASKGTLAHDVFEHLFRPDKPLPKATEIKAQIPALLNQAIISKKPFLLGQEWHVERRHLQRDIEIAALRWQELLQEMGAKVLGNEVWLRGKLDTLPIHGSADLLVELPKGRLYVVDYKKASSGPRRDRMRKGYDSQASLYRLMIETGGGGKDANATLKKAIEGANEISVAYYMLNDQIALADSNGWVKKSVTGMEELGTGIAVNAMSLIRQRIDELRAGNVKLNHEDDPDWYKKNAAVTIYALENSPLIALFMKTSDDQVCESTPQESKKQAKRGAK
ncbi:PD-(D/E)XK nuclease family protein [Geobacter sp. OR-1]|uniref:PD-(D/E)XK nuclease family protein n=1 Tax=Geobacter sp. OR-1 TaxID=1266765 RepID=UPI0013649F7C|nr:PD-(D/E)XK nuclease family protein [Geobacter sp. OR-1]